MTKLRSNDDGVLEPVLMPMAGVMELEHHCQGRGTTVVKLLASMGLRVALTGEGGVGGHDDGAVRLDEDEVIIVIAAVHLLRNLTGAEVLSLWRALEGTGLMRCWLCGVGEVYGPHTVMACAVVAHLGDLAMGRDLVNVSRHMPTRERDALLMDMGISGAEAALLTFEHGLPENAVSLAARAVAEPFTQDGGGA